MKIGNWIVSFAKRYEFDLYAAVVTDKQTKVHDNPFS
jgi:hypothetical protein